MDSEEMTQKKTKHTLWLREGDFRKLAEIHPELGSSKVARILIANHVDKMQDLPPASHPLIEELDV